ncbi:hypothetical protein LJB88_02110 [Erysipelotrichaceae bacterium OttesenSCG-928-M19]|nr:hypothetical protein [Erysipelotrichaceae bacterium OttesenSCG-928-M19]
MNYLERKYNNLGTKLNKARLYVLNRYDFYNDENSSNYGVSLKNHSDAIKQTIDGLRNRLLVSHFINAKSVEEYFTSNFMNKVIKSALISGCAFARIVKNDDGSIELIPYDAYFATGSLNSDNTLYEAITIDSTDENGNPTKITHYTENEIVINDIKLGKEIVLKNNVGVVPIIPIIINQNALKPFGSSCITKKMMSDTKLLRITKKRADDIQETLSKANTFLLGVSNDFKKELDKETLEQVKNIIAITKDADSQTPSVVTRENGISQLEDKIKDLENSIKYNTKESEYSNLVEGIREDLIESVNLIGNALIKVMNSDKNAKLNGKIDICFKNNDFSEFSAFMDGVLKVNQVVPGYLGKEQLDKILGINGNKSKLTEAIKESIKTEIDDFDSKVGE